MSSSAPSNDTISKILGQLGTDHAFREQMLGDPVAALKPYGIDVDPAKVPAVRQLPPMSEMNGIQQKFQQNPQDKSCIMVFIVLGA